MLLRILACFILGAIPFSVFLSKLFLKEDIRNIGSGNVGTTNAYRAGGAKFAIVIALLDMMKGYVAVEYLLPGGACLSGIATLAVCSGQMFSPFLQLKGGKGVGCYVGALMAQNLQLGIIFGLSWILLVKVIKQPFLASFLILGGSMLMFENNYYKFLVIGLILFKHIGNIQGFLNKKQNN